MADDQPKPPFQLHKFDPKPQDPWLKLAPIDYLEDLCVRVRQDPESVRGVLIFFLDAVGKPTIWRAGCDLSQQIAFGALIQELGLAEWRGDK